MSKALLVLKVFYKQAAKAKVFVLGFERTIKNTSAEQAKEST